MGRFEAEVQRAVQAHPTLKGMLLNLSIGAGMNNTEGPGYVFITIVDEAKLEKAGIIRVSGII